MDFKEKYMVAKTGTINKKEKKNNLMD